MNTERLNAPPISPLATLRREGATPPSTPPHSWWQTTRHGRDASATMIFAVDLDNEVGSRPGSSSDAKPVRHCHDRVYHSEGGLSGSLLGGPREPSSVVAAAAERARRTYCWAQPKRAAKAGHKTLASSRSMTLPSDFVKWDVLPAGRSTLHMDQPSASSYLCHSRQYGMPRGAAGHHWNWRGAGLDGMELQTGSFGQMLQPSFGKHNKMHKYTKDGVLFDSRRQNHFPDLRRLARTEQVNIPHTIPVSATA